MQFRSLLARALVMVDRSRQLAATSRLRAQESRERIVAEAEHLRTESTASVEHEQVTRAIVKPPIRGGSGADEKQPPRPRKEIAITLSEEAFQLARASKNVVLPTGIVAKIVATPIDLSLGNDRLCRHPLLTIDEAKTVYEYYRRSAEAFSKVGDRGHALICAKARAAIRQELWKTGLA